MALKLVIGISGASGSKLALRLLEILKNNNIETYLIITDAARITWEYEMDEDISVLNDLCTEVLDNHNIAASVASGSFKCDGMIIIPCSMKTVAGINSGYTDNLLLRAVDVMIKEKRKVVLCFRESILSPIHLRNLYELSNISSIYILPMVMTYYNKPENIEDMENSLIGKIMDIFNLEFKDFKRWN